MKCIYLLLVVSAVVVYFDSGYCYVSISNRDEIYEFIPEPPCAVQGGSCLRESECPAGLLTSTKGLCPAQKAQGAECCYGISTKETRCRARGGDCVETAICGNAPLDELATDCASGEVCCIWLV